MYRTEAERAAFILSLIAVVVTGFTLIFIGVQLSRDKGDEKAHTRQQTAYFGENGVCISCSNLEYEASYVMRQLKRTYKDGKELCCANNSDEMSALLELVILLKGSPQDESPKKIGSSRVRAHKRLLPGNEGAKALKVSPVESGTQHIRGVDAGEDFLYIKHTGIYYVYASFHVNASSSQGGKIFYGNIYRQGGSQSAPSGILTKVAHRVCRDCANDESTAFGGGIFKLFEGDRIQIRTENSTIIAFKQDSCYVGLVILGSG